MTSNQQLLLQDLDAEQYVLDGVSDFFMLYTFGTNVDDSLLVGSIHQRVHVDELSHGWASQERKRQW